MIKLYLIKLIIIYLSLSFASMEIIISKIDKNENDDYDEMINHARGKIVEILKTKNKEAECWADEVLKVLLKNEVNTFRRIAHFFAQTCHESLYYTDMVESLNYSTERLIEIFSRKTISVEQAEKYGRNKDHPADQKALGSILYGNRLGNGPPESQDGYKYRGRGLIQITGKANYKNCSNEMFGDDRLVENPDLLTDDKYNAIVSAVWYWNSKNINVLADKDDIKAVTKAVNGGLNGFNQRKFFYQKFNS